MGPEGTGAAAGEHYFSPAPASGTRPRRVELVLPDASFTLTTDRGVFSPEGVDPGTKLLLLEGPPPDPDETGPLLDLGCGYGPIALALARRAPSAAVWAIDVNDRARALCAANASAAGLTNVTAVEPDRVPEGLRFAGIWSNPPIRIGKAALHDLLSHWLGRLSPEGAAHLVVHKHLGSDSLARWLGSEGWAVRRLASRRGYRLLDVAPR